MMALIAGLAAAQIAGAQVAVADAAGPVLWYRQPATEYKSGLPVGNGRIGAMVLGAPENERIALNNQYLWRGKTRDRVNPKVADQLPAIRDLFFKGDMLEATRRCTDGFGVNFKGVDSYQPFGDLFLQFPDATGCTDYRRSLDLSTGVAATTFRCGGVQYTRQVYASRPDGVMVVTLSTDKPGALNGRLALSRAADPECALQPWASGGAFGFHGRFQEGLEFAAEARVNCHGGQVLCRTEGASALAEIRGASAVTVTLALATDKEASDLRLASPALAAAQILDRAQGKTGPDPEKLLARHIRAHRKLFNRVSLRLGVPRTQIPTDQRLADIRKGVADADIEALYFQYGRYLLMSCSAPGGLPANLQGLWNDELQPPWDCDIHMDVNVQMNYWPAEAGNLSECQDPLFDYVRRLEADGRSAAKDLYGCGGTYIANVGDRWAKVNKTQGKWSEWTGAAAWLAQHFWLRYEFTQDRAFLRQQAYPLFKDVAQFYMDYLVPDPRPDSRWKGRLVTVPSQSPENRFVGGADPVSLCIGATMDFELIHDVFTHLIRASEILGVDEAERPAWRRVLQQIPPLQTGRWGQLQEWLEDYQEVEPGHRHVSHLFALYPGDQITLEGTPALARAARTSLERRLAAEGGHTGWSRAWTVCLWARLGEGDKAEEHLRHLIGDFATDSLLDLHPPRIFQIDGNFGGTAGVIEMLLQSHGGQVRLLPALPAAWAEGQVKGLRARGGFQVDISWRADGSGQAKVKPLAGGVLTLRLPPGRHLKRITCEGQDVDCQSGRDGSLRIPARKGRTVTVEFAQGS